MPMSDYLEQRLLDHIYAGVTFTPPTTVYLRLFTAAPDDTSGSGTQVSGGSYAPQPVSMNPASSPDGTMTNATAITFTNMPSCTIVAVGLFSGSNMLQYDELDTPYTVASGDNLNLAIGDLTVALD